MTHSDAQIERAARAMEEWRPAVGWESLYEVSSAGAIRRNDGFVVGQWLSGQGYMRARLSQPRRQVRVHRLVAQAFLAPDPDRPNVNHKDNNRANNAVANLEWCTQPENLAHMTSQGRRRSGNQTGEKNPKAKLNYQSASEIRQQRASGVPAQRLAERYGISKSAVNRVLSGTTWMPLPTPPEGETK